MTEKLKLTGERVVPGDIRTLEEYLQYLRHLFAYEYVKSQLRADDKVLELGSGEGYGASLLSQACREIVGLDIDEKVIEYSNHKYGNAKCSFKHYDGSALPFPENYFDVVVSFQVIEHVEDDAGFVARIFKVLNKGGRTYITTPNRATRLKPGQRPWNRFHIREYHPHELETILRKSFNDVNVIGLSATPEIRHLEAQRIRQGFFLSLALRLGIRLMIPKSLDPTISRIFGRLRGQKKISANDDFKQKFSLDDFLIEDKKVEESLDLLGVCLKS